MHFRASVDGGREGLRGTDGTRPLEGRFHQGQRGGRLVVQLPVVDVVFARRVPGGDRADECREGVQPTGAVDGNDFRIEPELCAQRLGRPLQVVRRQLRVTDVAGIRDQVVHGLGDVVGRAFAAQQRELHDERVRIEAARKRAESQAAARWPRAITKLIEAKANGPAIISALQGKVSGIIPIEPHGSKVSRAQAVSPIVEAGNVYIPDESTCAWVPDFIEECAAFTGQDGEINDQVDATTQALFWMSQARLIDTSELADEGSFIDSDNLGGGFAA